MTAENKDTQIEHLLNELYELRVALAEIGRKVSKMDSAVKRAFPNVIAPRAVAAKRDKITAGDPSTINREEALSFFDQLRDVAAAGGTEAALRKLDSLSIANLAFLAKELGATVGTKKPSRRVLANEVLGRVRQSIMLRQHTPVSTEQ
jgi:hypothetical protein